MVKTFPTNDDPTAPIVRVTKPAMEWEDINLNDLLGCLRRELALRQRVYPKWVGKGSMTQAKADRELELMRQCVDFLVHCIFKAVVARRSLTLTRGEISPDGQSSTESASIHHKG